MDGWPEYFIDQIDRGGRADDYGSGTLYFDNDDYSLDDFGKALSGRNSVMDFYNGKWAWKKCSNFFPAHFYYVILLILFFYTEHKP